MKPEVGSGRWFTRLLRLRELAGLRIGDFFLLDQGWVDSVQLKIRRAEILIRGSLTLRGEHAGLADTCNALIADLTPTIPHAKDAVGLSAVAEGHRLRLGFTLDLAKDPTAAKWLPPLVLLPDVTTQPTSRATTLQGCAESTDPGQTLASTFGSAVDNLLRVLTGALSLPFLTRCGGRAKKKCTRFLAASLGPRDVVNLSQQRGRWTAMTPGFEPHRPLEARPPAHDPRPPTLPGGSERRGHGERARSWSAPAPERVGGRGGWWARRPRGARAHEVAQAAGAV